MTDQFSKVYSFFQQKGFLPVDKESYSVFKGYESYSLFQEMGATIITTWSFAYNGLYKVIQGYLCSLYFYEGKQVYFAVHRPQTSDYSLQQIVDMLYGLSQEAGLPFLQIKFIEERYLKDYEAIQGYHIHAEYREEDSEYAYRVTDFLELSGNANQLKRRHLNKFFNAPNSSLRPMTKENISVCLAIEEAWCHSKECSYCESFSGCEKKAMEIMIDIFDDRIYNGLIGYWDDQPAGYVIWEKRNEKIAFLYFGKSNIQNHYTYLLYMMAKNYLPGVEYWNMNEDMGNMGLRMFKRHLGVYELWRKYICTFTK